MLTTELPAALVEHARRFYTQGGAPAAPRRAATVLLLREAGTTAESFEVYAIRRAATMAFAAGMYAFPGGGVDPRDEGAALRWTGPSPEIWGERLGVPPAEAQAVVCAAVREVFEESGVLLAGPDEATVVRDVSTAEWETTRAALAAHETNFAEVLSERGLTLRADLLAPWGRWLTPEFEPRRYDTWFFLARLPEGQHTRRVGDEADHAAWLCPDRAGELPMLPPTRITLVELSRYRSIDAAMGARRDARTVVMPRVDLATGHLVIDLPGGDPREPVDVAR
ncbi:MAG TPA: NUDIX hydrolase [Micromonosporaceae bacterium]